MLLVIAPRSTTASPRVFEDAASGIVCMSVLTAADCPRGTLSPVVGVDSGLAAVEMRRRDPLGGGAGGFSSCPAVVGDQAVVGAAGQGEVVDVGLPAGGPVAVGVMDLTPRRRHGAPWARATPLGGVQHQPL